MLATANPRSSADEPHCQTMVISMKLDWKRIPLYKCLFQSNVYRGNQGRLIRRLAFFILVSCAILASQRVYLAINQSFDFISVTAVAFATVATFAWVAYRLTQYQPLADFLIDVQQESIKVSWCTLQELRRTTGVILAAMVIFSVYLFACDVTWQFILRSLSVLRI